MKKTARVLLAGYKGMVGSAIHRVLESRDYSNVILLDRDELDLLRQEAVEAFFDKERPEYVFLAAAKVGGILANNTERGAFLYENLQLQNNVIHSAYRFGVKKLLFLGSSCIYPKLAPQPLKEEYLLTSELEPTNEPYAIAKIAGLKMCESYNRQYGTNFISAMPTNLYGPNDNFNVRTSHVLPALIRKFHLAKLLHAGDEAGIRTDLQRNRDLPESDRGIDEVLHGFGIHEDTVEVWGTGSPKREFLHVDDCASALVFMMEQYDGTPFLNVGCGEDVSIRELAEIVREIVGFSGGIFFNADYPDGTPRKLMDVGKLRSLGWSPAIPLHEGIDSTYRWYLRTFAHQYTTESRER